MSSSIIIKIFIVCLIIYLAYRIYRHYHPAQEATYKVLIDKPLTVDEDYKRVIKRTEIFEPKTNFSIGWHMKLYNISSNFLWKSSFRLSKPIIDNGGCPVIMYNPADHVLILKFHMIDNNFNTFDKEIRIKDLPVQAWFHILVTVENRFINIYLNGELKNSYKLSTIPTLPDGNLQIGQINNNFLGKLNNVTYYDYIVPMSEAKGLGKL